MSSKTKIIYAVLFMILLLISIKAGFALQEDFNAYAPNKVLYVCACSDVENVITLENTGDVTSVYGIKQSGTAENYSVFNPSTFSLKPGESKEVHNFIGAPCGAEGKFELKTTIDTAFGIVKELDQTVDIRECINVDIVQIQEPAEVCPCSPARYDFLVRNTGDFVDTYRINVTPFPEYVTVSEDVLVLGPGQSKEIYVFVAAPCGVYGDMDFNLIVDAQRTSIRAELPFNLKINPCYDYSVASANTQHVCQDIRNVAPVTVTNNADVANTYFLSTDTGWSFFDMGVLSLGKRQYSDVNLTFYPASVPEGQYNVTLKSVSERGELVVDKSVDVFVENCYSIVLTADEVPQLVSCEEYTALGHATNDGTRESTYSFSLFGEPWASLGMPFSSVKAGETKDVPVKMKVPCNETGNYEFTLVANVTNFPEKVVQQKFAFEVIPVETAYAVEIESIEEKIESNYEGKLVPLTVSNLGIRGGKYNLFLNTTESWISLDKTSIDMAPGGSETVNIVLVPSNETPEGKYEVSLTAVPEGQNVGYEKFFSIKLRDKTFWEKVKDSWLYLLSALLFLVLLILLLAFALRKKEGKEEEFWKGVEGAPSKIIAEEKTEKLLEVEKKDRKWLKWLLLILGLLILLGAIAAGIYFLVSYLTTPINETENVTEAPEIEIPEEQMNITEEKKETGLGLLSRAWMWLFGEKNETINETVEVIEEPEPTPESFVENATIYVNRSGLRGSGNMIEVSGKENITIPLTIQNNYEPNTFRIKINESVEWIEVDRGSVDIAPNQKEVVNIIVMPNEDVEEGNYRIDIKIDIEGRQTPISEEIVLKVSQEKPFYLKYIWYILAGLIVLLVLAAIAGAKNYSKRKEEQEVEDFVKKGEKKELKEDFLEEKGDYAWLRYLIVGLLIMLILAGLVYGGLYAVKSLVKGYEGNETGNESIEQPAIEEVVESPVEQAPEMVVEEPEIRYEKVFIKKSEETLIPLKISNANETATFQIKINEDIDWITVDASEVEIGPNESRTVNLIASPNETVEDGNYKVTVDVEVAGEETKFTQGFILQVRESQFSALWSYLLYALAGIALLLIIVAVLGMKEKKALEGVEEEKAEDKKRSSKKTKKSSTNIRLK